ncbi:hypothetical protein OG754_40375 (plasmid) [Streptomyces decoyicus]|uniref:hypothetical protein n=1 Tax=Streptomyces decoyicus TaxID=249567 RepID=UPI002E33CE15|nr:hypothetical protein [Streptomyces decoyicus]
MAQVSSYLTEHIQRFGEGIQPGPYETRLDVDCTPRREQDLTAGGFGQAACTAGVQ